MSATVIEICNALVDAIGSMELGGVQPQVERSYRTILSLDGLADGVVRVFVAPATAEMERGTRIGWSELHRVDIAVASKVSGDESQRREQMDQMMVFSEQLADSVRSMAMEVDGGRAKVDSITRDPIFSPEHFIEKGTFVTIVQATFSLMR